jgi:hypothetical protein
MKIYRRTLKCVLVWDMELGLAALVVTVNLAGGPVTTDTVDMATAIAAALEVGGACSMAAS